VDVTEVAVAFPIVTFPKADWPDTEILEAETPFNEDWPPTLNAPAIVEEPETNRVVAVPFVNASAWSAVVPVAVRAPIVAEANTPFVPWTVAANKVEPVAFVKVSDCRLAVPVAVRFPMVDARATNEPAYRLVVVTDVAVAFARTAFQRREAEPKASEASTLGRSAVETLPKTASPVDVTLAPDAPVNDKACNDVVPVAESDPTVTVPIVPLANCAPVA
jgi:hypothetical protein